MTYLMFARWFGIVSVILSLGVLFNLEDALEMAKKLVKTESGYILAGVLPVIFGSLSLLYMDCFGACWSMVITVVGLAMLLAGSFRVIFVQQWKAILSRYLEFLPFLFSLFGLMFGVILLYVGFVVG